MKEWALKKIKYLSEGSNDSDNLGQTPMRPRYEKTFVNVETGEYSVTTDLQSKTYRRNRYITDFFKTYEKSYSDRLVSELGCVVNPDFYPTISKFINTIKRKLKRKGIELLGYVWVRDVGDIKFEKHFHVLLATSRITAETFENILKKKKKGGYKCEFLKAPKGKKNYLVEKNLYADKKQRAFGKSRRFILIKANKDSLNTN
jgi:hypothetical protein